MPLALTLIAGKRAAANWDPGRRAGRNYWHDHDSHCVVRVMKVLMMKAGAAFASLHRQCVICRPTLARWSRRPSRRSHDRRRWGRTSPHRRLRPRGSQHTQWRSEQAFSLWFSTSRVELKAGQSVSPAFTGRDLSANPHWAVVTGDPAASQMVEAVVVIPPRISGGSREDRSRHNGDQSKLFHGHSPQRV